jgi:hypothetical protein
MKIKTLYFLLPFACTLAGLSLPMGADAQNYHAIEGSPFAGSLGIAANPASIVNTPYAWDINVFSLQVKNTTNAFTIYNYSLISRPDSSKFGFNNGNYSHYAHADFNIHLLNARFALNRRQAIAFGANLRGYMGVKADAYNYSDTLKTLNDFFAINQVNGTRPYNASLTSSSWIELFATYSQTIMDDENGRLNAGITLKAMRGISGAFARLQNGVVIPSSTGTAGGIDYSLKSASARYGYSANYDLWNNNRSTGQNSKDMLVHSQGGLALDLGAEYLVRPQVITYYDDDPDDYYSYEWKIGVALLDIGQNLYKYGTQSRVVNSPKASVLGTDLENKFSSGISTLRSFNDSLTTVVNSISPLSGGFKILNPARLSVNVDRPLMNHFSVNGTLTINLTSSGNSKTLSVQEINLLTLVPRWETKRWGVYLPVQYTVQGKLLVGGAFKAGPLLFGIHNWSNVFSKNKMQNGGGYIAIVIRPGKSVHVKEDKRYDCPKIGN